jgi:DNA-binding NarL/FixJ family response regulator
MHNGRNSEKRRPRVLLADDHSMMAEQLCSLLEKSCEVVGIVQDGQQLLDAAPKLKPDVIVLDVAMPVLNGLDAARQLAHSFPTARFVFLTMQDDAELAAAVLDLGRVGYVLKQFAASELVTAIFEVIQGRSYVTSQLRSKVSFGARQPMKELTARQREVLQLIAEGRPIKEIADILKISEKAIEFQKYHIMRTFNLENTADLISFALNCRSNSS